MAREIFGYCYFYMEADRLESYLRMGVSVVYLWKEDCVWILGRGVDKAEIVTLMTIFFSSCHSPLPPQYLTTCPSISKAWLPPSDCIPSDFFVTRCCYMTHF